MPTILLLIVSNTFMTIAWYWHLRGGMSKPLFAVILISWSIALIEYCFAVPANRIGYANGWSPAQLKITQEVITLALFAIFALVWLKEPVHWRYFAAFGCMVAAVALVFSGK
jgi:uncharacterized protein (DUF486 family)